MLLDTNILPKDFAYNNKTVIVGLNKLDGYDNKAMYDKFMIDYKAYADLLNERVLVGTDLLQKEVFDKFPTYPYLKSYNVAFLQPSYTLNT